MEGVSVSSGRRDSDRRIPPPSLRKLAFARRSGSELLQSGAAIDEGCELILEVTERGRMHIFGGPNLAINSSTVERGCRVCHEVRLKAKIARHPHRRRYAMVCGEADHDQRFDACLPEIGFEGRAYEGAVHLATSCFWPRRSIR